MDSDDILSSKSLTMHLLQGSFFFPNSGFPDLESFRRGWELTRDVLLPQFCEEHPNRKPFAWWLIDHGNERPLLDPLPPGRSEAEIRRGIPPHRFGFLHTHYSPAVQQDEETYLNLRGLTSEWS